jgi:hypothetical protein
MLSKAIFFLFVHVSSCARQWISILAIIAKLVEVEWTLLPIFSHIKQ